MDVHVKNNPEGTDINSQKRTTNGSVSDSSVVDKASNGITPKVAPAGSESEDTSESLSSILSAIRVDPGNIQNYINAGRIYMQASRFEESLSFYQQALKIDPKNKTVSNDLKELQHAISKGYESGSSESSYSAVKYCSQDPYPGDVELLTLEQEILDQKYLKGRLEVESGAINKDSAMQNTVLYQRNKMAGDHVTALHYLSKAISNDPMNAYLRLLRAEMRMEANDLSSALADLSIAPRNLRTKDIWKCGGKILCELNLPVVAELWLRRATKLSQPGDDEAAILFQKARVSRLYGPLTINLPVRVDFSTYGRAVFATKNISPGTIILTDSPCICSNVLESWDQPVCFHCGDSLLTANDYFNTTWGDLPDSLKDLVDEKWPKVGNFPCHHCTKEVYCCEVCRTESWDRYHSVICPGLHPDTEILYEISENKGKYYNAAEKRWEEVWSAVFSPFVLAKIWASIVTEVKNAMEVENTSVPNIEHWARAKAPFRRFIAFGTIDAATDMPKMVSMFKDIFQNCHPLIKYDITDAEFNGRYFQAACNLQSYCAPIDNYRRFVNKLTDDIRAIGLLKHIEKPPKDVTISGLFPLHACVNHSCLNNVFVANEFCNERPGVCVRALREIKTNEELLNAYIDTSLPRKLRRAWLFRSFNFWCSCERCQFEGDEASTCTNCSKSSGSDGKVFPACGRCGRAWYCSVKCQKASWKRGHRKICSDVINATYTS